MTRIDKKNLLVIEMLELSRSAFHSTKNSEIFDTESNGMGISRENVQKIE